MYSSLFTCTYDELHELTIDVLKESGFRVDSGHPEDLVNQYLPAFQAVAAGWAAGHKSAINAAAKRALKESHE